MLSEGFAVVAVAFLAGGTAVAVGTAAWQNRGEPGATSFAVLMAGVAIWSLSYALALTAFDPGVRELFEIPLEVGKAIVAPAWLCFALGYTGRGEYVTRRLVAALSVVPVVTTALVATAPSHGLMWTDYRIEPAFGSATVAFDPGIWFYVHAAFGWVVIGSGMVFLLGPVLSYGALYRDQGIALILGAAVSFAAHVKAVFFLPPVPVLDLTPLTLAATGVLFGFALFRFDLQGLLPATQALGRRAAIEDVGVGLVVVNSDGRIIEFNAAARPVLGIGRGGATGDPDGDRDGDGDYGPDRDGDEDLDRTVAGDSLTAYVPDIDLAADGPQRIEQSDETGYRVYEATVSGIEDHHGRPVGYTITFADVTDREARRQRLEVLNRVLRHNLRNDMTVVVGNADLLVERVDEDDRPLADAISRRGRALQRLGEKARDVEDVLDDETDARETDVVDLVRTAVGDVRDPYPDASIALDAPDRLSLHVRPPVFRVVVANLVENALEHGGDGVRVRVSVGVDDDGVRVVVADDGPGIPEGELESLRSGTETALSHGSGLGLWVVQWGTRLLGADLSFEGRDPSGTRVRVTLPRSTLVAGDDGGDTDSVDADGTETAADDDAADASAADDGAADDDREDAGSREAHTAPDDTGAGGEGRPPGPSLADRDDGT
ncbi:ATP-binding protein [Halobaculum sp. CBA1158]|uniref:histidine kinase N-terminal 7TM domain-containing protein n=1 Tax=Halobaculum sp. CBA1158 TaxID=2904243 RepID=UPI001F1E41A0|nr:histidine kinase N-terminal 7TM domain-containing protein [Halobaculum sp. CBA1158]UIP01038.1 ATP-binding protein [Halobaculum sp. CBA1158]